MPASPLPCVTFVLGNLERDWSDLAALDEGEIERSPRRFQGGRNSWIAQGFLRLRAELERRGHRVCIACRVPSDGIAIVHRDDANDWHAERAGALLVVVRADRAPVVACDVAIAQNGTALRRNERFIPLWPQPGLVPRQVERGTHITKLAYHGRKEKLPVWLADRPFLAALAARGVSFEARAAGWEDYRRTDLAIAARDDSAAMLATKPATKIYNAWLAGVPVLAKVEPAYREVRRSDLDFLEIETPQDVIAAIDRLKSSPGLYEAMVANGRFHAREFDIEAIRARWLDLFDTEFVPAHERAMRWARPLRRAWYVGAMSAQKAMGRAFKARVGFERWRLFSPWTPARLVEETGRGLASSFLPPLPGAGKGAGGTLP